MDLQTLTSSVTDLTNNLLTLSAEKCPDEFLTALNNLMDITKKLLIRFESSSSAIDQNSSGSLSSDIKLYISESSIMEVDDSDSEPSSNISTKSSPLNKGTIEFREPCVELNRLTQEELIAFFEKNPCRVLLRQVDVTGMTSNSVPKQEKIEKKEKSAMLKLKRRVEKKSHGKRLK
ncbi:hypothetical protein Bhyg_14354 [Pseudolycoriella hygida]|uniref:Uncharacterized protein n=1 Tax=Pseudolycoriella hygida TaxID=35572 RepID=A0A9Q0RXC8_9DIPT|nr:hypothetical protein Bhyg_14354 [Pseudolycoriella hygida]